MNPRLEQVLRDFQRELTRHDRELDTLKRAARTPQLAHSSLEEGQAIETRSEDGTTRQLIGWLPDGTVGMITEGGDPVSAPSVPVVIPSLGGLRVTWDGTLSGELALPGDFDHMAVHVSTTSGFEPSAATYQGSIRRAGEGGMLPVVPLPYVEHYVVLVPVTTGGVQGVPSAEVAATPLQVDGADLTVGSVTAPIIAAGAVEADKLEAILVLASTIIAGIPGAARVELDQDGLRGYSTDNTLVFAVDSSGNAVFSGDITGSEITGSRMTIDSGTGSVGVIEDASGIVRARVTSASQARAQLAATDTQAEFSVWGNAASPTTPAGGMIAASGVCQIGLYSDASNLSTKPVVSLSAFTDETRLSARSGGGSEVLIRALPDYASIMLTAPPATDPADAQASGYLYAQRYTNDIAAVSMQGPMWAAGSGPERDRRSMLHLEGARPDRAYTRAVHSARRHLVQGEWDGTGISSSDGVLDIASTHSIIAPRHAPLTTTLTANPSFTTAGSYVDFTAAQMPPIPFRTGWSGRVKISLMSAGYNATGTDTNLRLAFRLSGAQTISASPDRGTWMTNSGTGSTTRSMSTRIVVMELQGNASYTLHPQWYSSTNTGAVTFSVALGNTIIVEPLT
jgi:hypothetical protein